MDLQKGSTISYESLNKGIVNRRKLLYLQVARTMYKLTFANAKVPCFRDLQVEGKSPFRERGFGGKVT